jgi:hypothetical protein
MSKEKQEKQAKNMIENYMRVVGVCIETVENRGRVEVWDKSGRSKIAGKKGRRKEEEEVVDVKLTNIFLTVKYQ